MGFVVVDVALLYFFFVANNNFLSSPSSLKKLFINNFYFISSFISVSIFLSFFCTLRKEAKFLWLKFFSDIWSVVSFSTVQLSRFLFTFHHFFSSSYSQQRLFFFCDKVRQFFLSNSFKISISEEALKRSNKKIKNYIFYDKLHDFNFCLFIFWVVTLWRFSLVILFS